MEITEVRIKLVDNSSDRLQAFCTITFDGEFVVRDLRVIQGPKGPFVAMPSRKLMDKCPFCSTRNELRATYCNGCGKNLPNAETNHSSRRMRTFADIAHPINSSCRERIQSAVIAAFEEETVRSQQPDYVCAYDDHDDILVLSRASHPPTGGTT